MEFFRFMNQNFEKWKRSQENGIGFLKRRAFGKKVLAEIKDDDKTNKYSKHVDNNIRKHTTITSIYSQSQDITQISFSHKAWFFCYLKKIEMDLNTFQDRAISCYAIPGSWNKISLIFELSYLKHLFFEYSLSLVSWLLSYLVILIQQTKRLQKKYLLTLLIKYINHVYSNLYWNLAKMEKKKWILRITSES